jgi:hypothetical protein
MNPKCAFILTIFLSIACASTALAGSDDVWTETNTTMQTLLEKEYKVVGTDFSYQTTSLSQYREVVYLQKEGSLYRCTTTKSAGGSVFHKCYVVGASAE